MRHALRGTRKHGSEPLGRGRQPGRANPPWGHKNPLPTSPHWLREGGLGLCESTPPLSCSAQEGRGNLAWVLPAGRMEDEGPECGKPDFVLLDQVTMEDFMENLKLR